MTYFGVPSQNVSPMPDISGQYYASGEMLSAFLIKKFPFKYLESFTIKAYQGFCIV